MSNVLADLEGAIAQFQQNPMPIGITLHCSLRERLKAKFSTVPGLRPMERLSDIPVYFVDRQQPEECRVWTDQEMLSAWLRFNETGDRYTVNAQNIAAVNAIAGFLIAQGHIQVLDIKYCLGAPRCLTDGSAAILWDALECNGLTVEETELVNFADRVNVNLAKAIAKQRGWGVR